MGDVVSQLMRVHGTTAATAGTPSPSTMAVTTSLLRTSGLAGLYRGFGVQLLSTMPTHALFWGCHHAVYQRLLVAFNQHRTDGMANGTGTGKSSSMRTETAPAPLFLTALSAFGSAAFASYVSTPVDVIKTRMQVEGVGLKPTVSALLKEGSGSFMRGSSARVLKYTPMVTVVATYFEFLKRSAIGSE